jgi:hypothetical protein
MIIGRVMRNVSTENTLLISVVTQDKKGKHVEDKVKEGTV